MSTTTTAPVATTTATKVDFGAGRYSGVMTEFYADTGRLTNLTAEKREKAARQLGVDLGRAFAAQPVEVKYKSINKDGRMTLAEAAKVKGFMATPALSLAKEIAAANEINARKVARVESLALVGTLKDWADAL